MKKGEGGREVGCFLNDSDADIPLCRRREDGVTWPCVSRLSTASVGKTRETGTRDSHCCVVVVGGGVVVFSLDE